MSTAIKLYLEDMHDGNHMVVDSTLDFWTRLVAPAVKNGHPIDGSTVNHALLDPLFEKGAHKKVRSIPDSAEHVIPLV